MRYGAPAGTSRAHRVSCALGAAQQSHQLAPAHSLPTPSRHPRRPRCLRCRRISQRARSRGFCSRRSLFPRCLSHRFPRIYSTFYSTHRAHRGSQVLWWYRLRCNRAPHRRCTHPRRFCPRVLPCSLHLKSERRSLWALNPFKPQRSTPHPLKQSRKSERSSQCALNLCKSERLSLWALNPLKAERSMLQVLNQSRKWERRSLCALISRRQPGRSLERSPPTGTRKTPTGYSSSRVVRASASRPATRSQDLLPTASCSSASARARCTTGGTF